MAVPLIATKIELALGANLTGNPASWVWTDVSNPALGSESKPVSVTFGRADEASQTAPTRCTFRLANTDGRFSPRNPTSPYYPNVRRQTPVRISLNPGTGYVQRFQGYIDAIAPSWPAGNSQVAEVSIVASGILRRLGQGNKLLRSALYRAVTQSTAVPIAYWPLEDGSQTTVAASAIAGVGPMTPSGTGIAFARAQGAPGSDVQAELYQTASVNQVLIGTMPSFVGSVTHWRIEYLAKSGLIPSGHFSPAASLVCGTANGSTYSLDLWDIANGGVSVSASDNVGSLLGAGGGSNVAADDGLWHELRLDAQQSGSNAVFTIHLDGNQIYTVTTVAAHTLTPLSGQIVLKGGISTVDVGHVIVWFQDVSSGTLDTVDAMRGHPGETADARITRLCGEQNVPVTITGTSTTTMGAQGVDTFLNLLREVEAADLGILFDGAGPGLSYLCRSARYNQAVALALDCNRYQVKLPFQPVEDDQRIRNDWTVTRKNGSWKQATDPVHIAANGLYDASTTVNVQNDADLFDQASARVHINTADEMRLPSLTFDPLHNPELQAPWTATTLGQRLTAANLPTQYPTQSTDQIVEGYTEQWDSVTWSVTPNLSPYRPWEAFTIQDTRLGRIETDGSTLHAGIAAQPQNFAESWTVDCSGGLWDTGSTPFDIEIEGEQITVTAVTGSSSPQTFTVKRAINGIVKAHGVSAVVKLWKPGVLAL